MVFRGGRYYDWTGESVALVPDIDGDGLDELVIGARSDNTDEPGKASLVQAATTPSSTCSRAVVSDGQRPHLPRCRPTIVMPAARVVGSSVTRSALNPSALPQ